MILLLTLPVGVVCGATLVLWEVPRQSRGLCERRPFKGCVSALRWAGPTYSKPRRQPLSKCERPRDLPNVEPENPGVEENALESRMRSNAPCALPDNLVWPFVGGPSGMVKVALSPSERLLVASLAGSSTCELRILDLASGQVHATCAGVHDDFVCDLRWRAFERSGAHPLVISCGEGVVQL